MTEIALFQSYTAKFTDLNVYAVFHAVRLTAKRYHRRPGQFLLKESRFATIEDRRFGGLLARKPVNLVLVKECRHIGFYEICPVLGRNSHIQGISVHRH